jgi:hypothetical protein|tara:strand:- start:3024 stop:3551 length:528 start_codon:yes stop_codon:yes gene_type:complete
MPNGMTPPPLPVDPRDVEQVRLLVIFHYVAAGIGVAAFLGLGLHFMFMKVVFTTLEDLPAIITADQPAKEPPVVGEEVVLPVEIEKVNEIPPELFSNMFAPFVYFYLFLGVFIVLKIILNLMSAHYMGRRRHKVFSMITAGLNCLSIPLGTILGIFTFVVLSRQSVEAIYHKAAK